MSADITKPETWYGLGLGESVKFSDTFLLRRVPGGWLSVRFIRTGGHTHDDQSSLNMHIVETFIPFSLEFCSIEHLPLVLQTQTSFAGEKNND